MLVWHIDAISLTLLDTMIFAPLITFSGKIKHEHLGKCRNILSEKEFSFS